MLEAASCCGAVFQRQGLRKSTTVKTQSRAFRTSDWVEGLHSNRTMTLSTQQEWLYTTLWMSLSGPASSHSLDLNPIKYFWRNLKMCVCPHPTWKSLRGEEVKRWGDKWQIIAKCWWTKRVTSNKQKTWGTSAKYLVRGMNTYAMYLFEFLFVIHLRSCYNSVFALSIWCIDWCGGKKSHLK